MPGRSQCRGETTSLAIRCSKGKGRACGPRQVAAVDILSAVFAAGDEGGSAALELSWLSGLGLTGRDSASVHDSGVLVAGKRVSHAALQSHGLLMLAAAGGSDEATHLLAQRYDPHSGGADVESTDGQTGASAAEGIRPLAGVRWGHMSRGMGQARGSLGGPLGLARAVAAAGGSAMCSWGLSSDGAGRSKILTG